jgi:hypothetical protein
MKNVLILFWVLTSYRRKGKENYYGDGDAYSAYTDAQRNKNLKRRH